jgi:hypothetical protein
MRRWTIALVAAGVALLMAQSPSVVFAQGGGASSTATIQGRVTDTQGAVLPGVTVTASSTQRHFLSSMSVTTACAARRTIAR